MKFITDIADLVEGKIKPFHLENGDLIILIKRGQEVYALDGVCPHRGGPLDEGSLENGCVVCPWHGWRFDLKTGECLNAIGEDLKRYPIEIQGTKVYLIEE